MDPQVHNENEAADLVDRYRLERCTDCLSCTEVCPFREVMDVAPAQMVRRTVRDGCDEVLRSRGIWLCTDCRACSRACPAAIDVGAFIEALRRDAHRMAARANEPIEVMHVLLTDEATEAGRVRHGRLFLSMTFKHKGKFPRGGLALALAVKGKFGRVFGGRRPSRREEG